MPIDYSKFDNIGDSDDEDDRRAGSSGGGGGGGGGGGAGVDFQQLLRELQKSEGKEQGGRVDPGQLPDLYAAAGLGGAKGSRRKGPAPLAPPPPASGMGLGALDSYLDPYDDGYGGLEDGLGASRALDYVGLRAEAWQLLCTRLVALAGPAESVPRILLLEAEVHLLASRYRQAVVAGLAVQLATEGTQGSTPETPYGEWTASTFALEMVCSYQLGDRDHAVQLRETLKSMDRSSMSEHLAKRFDGTCEVLELVPAFLNLLKAQEQQEQQGLPAQAR